MVLKKLNIIFSYFSTTTYRVYPDEQILCHRCNFITNDPFLFILYLHVDAISRKMFWLMNPWALFINHGFPKMNLKKKTQEISRKFPC